MLLPYFIPDTIEAGCDEAGRGCLAGDVYAAAVVLPQSFDHPLLNDSKQLSERQRYSLRPVIEAEAVAWAVGIVTVREIEEINILNASILAMQRALDEVVKQLTGKGLSLQNIIVDGNRFKPYHDIPYSTQVKGDARFMSIAAASVLAKTYRDDYMIGLAQEYPAYDWATNKGYPTKKHRHAIALYGATPHHRTTFRLLDTQTSLNFCK